MHVLGDVGTRREQLGDEFFGMGGVRQVEQISQGELLFEAIVSIGYHFISSNRSWTLISPATYFCLLRITSYASSFALKVLVYSATRASFSSIPAYLYADKSDPRPNVRNIYRSALRNYALFLEYQFFRKPNS